MWGNGCLTPPPWVREIHSFHGRFWAPTDLEWPLIGWTFRYVHKILCISLRKFQFNQHYILITLLYMIHELSVYYIKKKSKNYLGQRLYKKFRI